MKESLIIDSVANGFIVMPPVLGDSQRRPEHRVFTDPESLAAFIREWAAEQEKNRTTA